MDFGYVIGYIGLVFGISIPIPQLIKCYKTRSVRDLAPLTFCLIVTWMACSFVYAVYRGDLLFMISQGYALVMNGTILMLIFRHRTRGQLWNLTRKRTR